LWIGSPFLVASLVFLVFWNNQIMDVLLIRAILEHIKRKDAKWAYAERIGVNKFLKIE
jgi:hypothetical protein